MCAYSRKTRIWLHKGLYKICRHNVHVQNLFPNNSRACSLYTVHRYYLLQTVFATKVPKLHKIYENFVYKNIFTHFHSSPFCCNEQTGSPRSSVRFAFTNTCNSEDKGMWTHCFKIILRISTPDSRRRSAEWDAMQHGVPGSRYTGSSPGSNVVPYSLDLPAVWRYSCWRPVGGRAPGNNCVPRNGRLWLWRGLYPGIPLSGKHKKNEERQVVWRRHNGIQQQNEMAKGSL